MFGVLLIHIWASRFVFMGAVYSNWIIAEGDLWSSLVRHGVGAVINVGLIFVLIPHWGLNGAALATVVSYAVANYFACFLGQAVPPAGVLHDARMLSPFTPPANTRPASVTKLTTHQSRGTSTVANSAR